RRTWRPSSSKPAQKAPPSATTRLGVGRRPAPLPGGQADPGTTADSVPARTQVGTATPAGSLGGVYGLSDRDAGPRRRLAVGCAGPGGHRAARRRGAARGDPAPRTGAGSGSAGRGEQGGGAGGGRLGHRGAAAAGG